jgi:hypothetical protein
MMNITFTTDTGKTKTTAINLNFATDFPYQIQNSGKYKITETYLKYRKHFILSIKESTWI